MSKRLTRYKGRGKGKRTSLSPEERLQWAREQWRNDISISVRGKDGMHYRMVEIFGVAPKDEELHQLKNEVREDLRRDEQMQRKQSKLRNPVIDFDQAKRIREKMMPSSARPAADSPPTIQDRPTGQQPKNTDAPEAPWFPAKKDPPSRAGIERLGTSRSKQCTEIRSQFARKFLNTHPEATNRETINAVRSEYGIGISHTSLYHLRRELGLRRLPAFDESHPKPRAPRQKSLIPQYPPHQITSEKSREDKEVGGEEETMKAAIQMLLDEVPNLKYLRIDKTENGRIKVDYEVHTIQKKTIEY